MKRIIILYSEYLPIIDALIYHLQEHTVECFDYIPDNLKEYDLIVDVNFNKQIECNSLKLHYSLLPAFDVDEPIKEAVLYGSKVTGITVYFTQTKEIVAQYPYLIKPLAHYDEIKTEMEYLAQTFLPVVVEKVLKNEIVESKSIISKCGCGGCSSCSH